MSYRNLNILGSYKSLGNNSILNDFFIPVLKETVSYYRCSGFFSVQALLDLYDGIEYLSKIKRGNIKIITSPNLSKEDCEFINKAYEKRDEIIARRINEVIEADVDEITKDKMEEIFKLIVNGQIDIKIAIVSTSGLFHDKSGVLVDEEKNMIAFYGSANDSHNAFFENLEKIRTACSWWGPESLRNVLDELSDFESYWYNYDEHVRTMDFPKAVKDKMISFIENRRTAKVLKKENEAQKEIRNTSLPRDYQNEAIQKWIENGYKGIFSMATGTGKTKTSIFAINKLLSDRPGNYFIVIAAPFSILVDQWNNEMKDFGFDTIVVNSSNPNWLALLQSKVSLLNAKMIDNIVVITTIASFISKKFNSVLERVRTDFIFIADEVHNFGAFNTHKHLPNHAKYRLGLSATPQRHFDDFGTKILLNYFGGVVYEYSLQKAIDNGFLCKYDYIPVIVHLSDFEQELYDDITEKVMKLLNINSEAGIYNLDIDEAIKHLLINRARIVAMACEKVPTLISEVKKIGECNNNLVYCGASFVFDDEDSNEYDTQIQSVVRELSKLNYWPGEYVSTKTAQEKKFVLDQFKNGLIKYLVAIKCLDEGVDIPSVERAFILASSTNTKEYIQRRGRVLRKDPNNPNKKKAVIYDFLTMPNICAKHITGLLKNEFDRFNEFMFNADNKEELKLIYESLINEYNYNIEESTINE